MKKNKKQNIILVAIGIIIIGIIISHNYSTEQTKQKGLKFGTDLQNIQEGIKQIQVEFNSRITQWQEGDLAKEELLNFAELHFQKFQELILRYDKLSPPDTFRSSVEIFKLSSQSQLESDKEYVEWIKNKKESNKIRSDSLLQESFEYEMMALGEFNAAKAGIKNYDMSGKFEPPKTDLSNKVNKIWEDMKDKCHYMYGIESESSNQKELEKCLNDSDNWKDEHLK